MSGEEAVITFNLPLYGHPNGIARVKLTAPMPPGWEFRIDDTLTFTVAEITREMVETRPQDEVISP